MVNTTAIVTPIALTIPEIIPANVNWDMLVTDLTAKVYKIYTVL